MAQYFIFKTDLKTNKTTSICNGYHETEAECRLHWTAYMYGCMDAIRELTGKYQDMSEGSHGRLSFRLQYAEHDVEYFMLLNEEGVTLHYQVCNL